MVKSTMTETCSAVLRSRRNAAAMAQNEQTTEERSTLEQQSPGRLDDILHITLSTRHFLVATYAGTLCANMLS